MTGLYPIIRRARRPLMILLMGAGGAKPVAVLWCLKAKPEPAAGGQERTRKACDGKVAAS